jgi:hypothetical protein
MTIKQSLAAQLEREVARSRKAIEQMPEGKADWKPHDKSMQFGYLADMVATIPMWIVAELKQDSLDIAPADGSKFPRTPKVTRADYLKALEDAAAQARLAFNETTVEGSRQRRAGSAAPPDDPRDDQPLVASSRTDDGVSALDGCQGAGALRAIRRREQLQVARGYMLRSVIASMVRASRIALSRSRSTKRTATPDVSR